MNKPIDAKKESEIEESVKFLFKTKGLSSIIRFSPRIKIINQSVSDHSFFVVTISYIIAKLEEKYNNANIDYEKLMSYSCMHDVPEAISGDINRDFKKMSSDFENLYEDVCGIAMRKNLENNPIGKDILEGCFGMANGSLEGDIVAAADIICPFIYVIQEKKLGNQALEDVYKNCKRILLNSNLESVRIIGKIISEMNYLGF
jgi:putative hydrolase of HD superfamily